LLFLRRTSRGRDYAGCAPEASKCEGAESRGCFLFAYGAIGPDSERDAFERHGGGFQKTIFTNIQFTRFGPRINLFVLF